MNLVAKLTEETKELKLAYLANIEKWASEEFDRLLEFKLNFQSKGGYKVELEKKYYSLHIFINTPENKGKKIEWVALQVKKAETHYQNSIEKLAFRVEKKGLNIDRIEMKSSFLDPNMSTTITDGENTIRAFTIIASGPVQKPHYRYLVK